MPPPGNLEDLLDLDDLAAPSAEPQKEKSFLDRLGGARGALTTGIRGLSGLGPGLWPGAILAGGGEALAEAIESPLTGGKGPMPSLSRILTEGAIGAVPLGKYLKIGRAAESALKGGAFSALGTGARELAAGQELDPRAIAESAALGGVTGGAFSKLLNISKAAPKAAEKFEIETTARPGGTVLSGSKKGPKTVPTGGIDPIGSTGGIGKPTVRPRVSTESPYQYPQSYAAMEPSPYRASAKAGVKAEAQRATALQQLQDQFETATGKKAAGLEQRAAKLEDEFGTALSKKAAGATQRGAQLSDEFEKAMGKKAMDLDAAEKIKAAKQGLEKQQSVTESIGAAIPGGTQKLVTRYTQPAEEGASELAEVLGAKAAPAAEVAPIPSKVAPIPANVAPKAKAGPSATEEQLLRELGTALKVPSKGGAPRVVPGPRTPKEGIPEALVPPEGPAWDVDPARAQRSEKAAKMVAGRQAKAAAAVPAEAPASPLMQILKTRTGATGKNYRLAQDAEKAGEIPSAALAREAHMRELHPEQAAVAPEAPVAASAAPVEPPVVAPDPSGIPTEQRLLEELGQALKVPVTHKAPRMVPKSEAMPELEQALSTQGPGVPRATRQGVPLATTPTLQAPDIEPQLAEATELLGQQGKTVDPAKYAALRDFLKSNKGEASTELMMQLGLGTGGALLGAATDPLGNPLASAAAGGVLGASAPMIFRQLQKLGVPDEAADALSQDNGMSITDRAKKIFEMLPQIQRFNYLADPFVQGTAVPAGGLAANAFAGPWGAGVMGALERWLSGDPRGLPMLQEMLNLPGFAKGYASALPEAASAIGRAEGRPLTEAASTFEKVMAGPGTYMTAGDITTKNIAQRHHFTPEEAQRMTMTAEPELKFTKNLARIPKGSTLAQIMFPFSRTPANILEQGSMRVPILGSAVQSFRETPDNLRTQLVQQGLGGAVGLGSAAVGANIDPEDASLPRRYLTNLAGAYSLPASLGFAAGQSMQKGNSPLQGLTNEMSYSLPVPTAEPIKEWGTALSQLLSGEEVSLPRGAVPAFLRNAPEFSPTAAGAAPDGSTAPLSDIGDLEDFLDLSDLPRTR